MSKGKHPHGETGGVHVPSFFLQSSHCKSHALHSAQTVESHVVHGLTLDVKLNAGGIKIKIMCISLEESLD